MRKLIVCFRKYPEIVIRSLYREAIAYIQKNYQQEELSTNFVARQVNLSTSWLSTKFKEEVGVGISDYLNSVRIHQAKKLFDEKTI